MTSTVTTQKYDKISVDENKKSEQTHNEASKFVFCCETLPKSNHDLATWNRCKVIPFEVSSDANTCEQINDVIKEATKEVKEALNKVSRAVNKAMNDEVKNEDNGYVKIEEKFEYVVMETGYTDRLKPKGQQHSKYYRSLMNEIEIEINCLIKDMNDDREDEEEKELPVELLFVCYTSKADENVVCKLGSDLSEVDELIKNVKEIGMLKSGIACYRCKHTYYNKLRKSVENHIYCAIHDQVESALYMSKTKPNIKVVVFDAESG